MQLIRTNDLIKAGKLDKLGGKNTAKLLMTLLQFDKINQIYSKHYFKDTSSFISDVLSDVGIKYEISDEDLARIPKTGSFILIANHPFGGIEGLILLNSILRIRPDLKIMANFLFNWIYPLREYIFCVNPFESRKEEKSSVLGLKNAFNHVCDGHPLVIFPAGEVSTYQNNSKGIIDRRWDITILKFIKNSGVPVLPVYFHGNNSWLFHLMGKIHPILRTAKIPSELLNKRNETIVVRIGNVISVKDQNHFYKIEQYGRYLRAKTYALGTTIEVSDFFKKRKKYSKVETIANAVNPNILAEEIISITPKYQFIQYHNFAVYCVPSAAIPNITKEIGRLREITFREVGEGTNRETDIDEFDLHYHQLFIWDGDKQKVAGGYRIGKGKDIMSQYGIKGFYTQTLFRMDKRMAPILSQSIELGRSFVTKEYQRKPMSLFLLWRGIFSFLLRNEEYKYLLGPVSISNSYTKLSQQVMVDYVTKHHFDHTIAKYIKPRNPFIPLSDNIDTGILSEKVQDFNTLDYFIKDTEPVGNKMPVLLKKYLQLGGKVVCFNIDPDFNNSLDGLLILNIKDVHPELIQALAKNIITEEC